MPAPAHDKYFLKSLHEQIDLFDRKLAHLLKHDEFPTETERQAAATKMNNKRELLARTARQLVSEGIEFKPSELPRSFRNADEVVAEKPAEAMPTEEVHALHLAPVSRRVPSPFAGTILDGQATIAAYKRSRVKATSPA